jgi:predicted DNA repair protein MutK
MVSLLTLLDEIATTLDDVAAMSKVAMQKTSAIMSDDLAVNAGVVTGVSPDRELPMVKAIFLGSLWNKLYCIVGVLVLMALYPPLIKVILVIGGLYLCYEGVHKAVEKLFHKKDATKAKLKAIPEAEKVKGAIRTDLILSIEIIVIAKGTLSGDYLTQVLSLVAVGLAASVVIYGLVAVIVKIDDFGLSLMKKGFERLGSTLVNAMPYMMKGLGIVGTIAMLLVGGGILTHTFHLPVYTDEYLQNCIIGTVAGAVIVGLFELKDQIQGTSNN